MPIYMQYGDVKGDVTAQGHLGGAGWVEIDSFQYGVGRSIESQVGGVKNREWSAPTVSEVVVTKPADVASTALLEEALYGEGKKVKIDFCKTDKGQLQVYQSYELENGMISSLAVSCNGGDRPHESLSISFTKVIYTFHGMDAKGEQADSPKTGYDLALGKTL